MSAETGPSYDCMAAFLEDNITGPLRRLDDRLIGVASRKQSEYTCRSCGACAVASFVSSKARNPIIKWVNLYVIPSFQDRHPTTTCPTYPNGIPTSFGA